MSETFSRHVNQFQEAVRLCGQSFIAHPTGALIETANNLLIVADLYLQSGSKWSVLQKLGNRSQASVQLGALKSLIDTYEIKEVIAIGRSFRRLDDPYHLDSNDLTTLYKMQKQVDWIWVAGPQARAYPNLVGGLRMVSYNHHGFNFRAFPTKGVTSQEVAAGMYPMVRLEREAEDDLILPCFVSNRERLLMPAFGGQLAARNILGDEFLPLFGYDEVCVQVVDQFKTYPVPRSLLKAG